EGIQTGRRSGGRGVRACAAARARCDAASELEVADAGGEAGDAAGVAEVEGVLVAPGAAGVDDDGDAGVDEDARAVVEGEEGVADRDRAVGAGAGLVGGDAAGGDAVDLSAADAEEAHRAGRAGGRRVI